MTTAYAQTVYLKGREEESYGAAIEQARLNAQLRKIEADNADFRRVEVALLTAKMHVDEERYPHTLEHLNEAIALIQKRILHVVGEREARELSTDGRLT